MFNFYFNRNFYSNRIFNIIRLKIFKGKFY